MIEEKLSSEDLHRPYVDAFVIKVNGKKMRRVKDVVDVRFDSGITS